VYLCPAGYKSAAIRKRDRDAVWIDGDRQGLTAAMPV